MQINWQKTQLSKKSFSLSRTWTGCVQMPGDKIRFCRMKRQRAPEPGLLPQDFGSTYRPKMCASPEGSSKPLFLPAVLFLQHSLFPQHNQLPQHRGLAIKPSQSPICQRREWRRGKAFWQLFTSPGFETHFCYAQSPHWVKCSGVSSPRRSKLPCPTALGGCCNSPAFWKSGLYSWPKVPRELVVE